MMVGSILPLNVSKITSSTLSYLKPYLSYNSLMIQYKLLTLIKTTILCTDLKSVCGNLLELASSRILT